MTRLISVLALVLATGAAAADYPAPLPVPVPLPPGRPYSLPHGYFSSGGWAVPSAGAA